MKKLFILALASLLLAACGAETADKEQKQENAPGKKAGQEEKTGKQTEEQTAEPAEKTEEEAVPGYKVNSGTYALEPLAEENPKVVLLTIDDAPDKHAVEMARTLKALDAPAIFFVNGHFIDSPEKEQELKEIYDMGFTIGNHTYSHSDLSTLTPEEQKNEIVRVNDQVEKITGERPKFFRAPFGKNTDTSTEIVKEEHMVQMNWTYGYDWEKNYMTKDAIADIMVNTESLRDGANLLMHDRQWTSEGLEQIVQGLRDKGYETLDPKKIETDI